MFSIYTLLYFTVRFNDMIVIPLIKRHSCDFTSSASAFYFPLLLFLVGLWQFISFWSNISTLSRTFLTLERIRWANMFLRWSLRNCTQSTIASPGSMGYWDRLLRDVTLHWFRAFNMEIKKNEHISVIELRFWNQRKCYKSNVKVYLYS